MSKNNSVAKWGFATEAVHAGEAPDPATGAIAPILVRSKTFAQKEFGVESEFQYSRGKNPTRAKLEEKLAALEGPVAKDGTLGQATVFGSGVAAEAAFFFTLSPGDHVLCCKEIYGGTFRLLDKLLVRFGIGYSFVDFADEKAVREVLKKYRGVDGKTAVKYFFVETPTNPSLHVIDLAKVGKLSRELGVPFVVDATFSPPCATRPFEYGAETVIHSLSKYIAGHNDILGGAVITQNPALHEQLGFMQRTAGAILSPDECYRVLQEVKTLELRWQRVSRTALEVAKFLEKSAKVKRVLYPGLASHAGHAVAVRQTKGGFGAVVSFEVKTSKYATLKKFVDTVREFSPIVYAESLASPETIIAYPALMSHKSMPIEVRHSLGISDSFFRISVGLEDPADIIRGLEAGLRGV